MFGRAVLASSDHSASFGGLFVPKEEPNDKLLDTVLREELKPDEVIGEMTSTLIRTSSLSLRVHT